MPMDQLRIVLVDDDADDREIFKLAISQINDKLDLKMCTSGKEVLDYLREPNRKLPNLLFLDLNMPNINGIECLKEIKQDPGLKHITVILYSTSSSEKDIEQTFLNGANIYLNKPADFETLKNSIKKILAIDWQYHTSILNRDNFLFRF